MTDILPGDTTSTGTGMRHLLGGIASWWTGSDPAGGSGPANPVTGGNTSSQPSDPGYSFNDVFDDDESIGDTIRLIRSTEQRWAQPESEKYSSRYQSELTRADLGDLQGDEVVADLYRRLEANNETILRLIATFDKATFKTDYAQLKVENDALAKKYEKLERQYKADIEAAQEVHKRYAQLARRYSELKRDTTAKDLAAKLRKKEARLAELERKEKRYARELEKAEERYSRVVKDGSRVASQTVKEASMYQEMYEEKRAECDAKARENERLKLRIAELERIGSAGSSAGSGNSLPSPPRNNDPTDPIERLRLKYQDKLVDQTEYAISSSAQRRVA